MHAAALTAIACASKQRRVQICLGLLRPYQILLCDEITVDLDVVARIDLLIFFRTETEQRGATIIYATHIFDGLEAWPTHAAYVERGKLKRCGTVEELPVRPCAAKKRRACMLRMLKC